MFYDSINMKCPEYAKQRRRKVISDLQGRVSRQCAVSANGIRFPFGAMKIFLNEVEVTIVCTIRVLKATKVSTLKLLNDRFYIIRIYPNFKKENMFWDPSLGKIR